MPRYAEIVDGEVINLIMWDGDTETWQPPEGVTMEILDDDEEVSIGWRWDGQEFTPPPETKPATEE